MVEWSRCERLCISVEISAVRAPSCRIDSATRDLVRWRHRHGLDLDGEKGELLAEVVVQLAGNPPALLLLSRQQAATQIADDRLGVFALGDVAGGAADQERLAGRVALDTAL